MSDVIYWAIVSAIAIGGSWFFIGREGFLFLTVVCILGGILQYIENILHPHIK